MIRRIVEVKSHEWLTEARKAKKFEIAKSSLESVIDTTKCKFDEKFPPITLNRNQSYTRKKPGEVIEKLSTVETEKEKCIRTCCIF